MQGVCVQKTEIGSRLKEERERLDMSQTQFAGLGEASKRAQITYEKGESTPDAAYLAAVAKVGADVQYIVTGVRSAQALSGDEQDLVAMFRAAPLDVKAMIIAGLKGGEAGRKEQVFKGDVGQAVNVSGNLDQTGISFNMGGAKKKK